MAEKLTVICDMHNRDHPATHFQVPVDMCDAAYAKHEARLAGQDRPMTLNEAVTSLDRARNEQDERHLLRHLVTDPGGSRSEYQEVLKWDQKRVVNAFNRLKKQGLVRSKGVGQAGRWHPTAQGMKVPM